MQAQKATLLQQTRVSITATQQTLFPIHDDTASCFHRQFHCIFNTATLSLSFQDTIIVLPCRSECSHEAAARRNCLRGCTATESPSEMSTPAATHTAHSQQMTTLTYMSCAYTISALYKNWGEYPLFTVQLLVRVMPQIVQCAWAGVLSVSQTRPSARNSLTDYLHDPSGSWTQQF